MIPGPPHGRFRAEARSGEQGLTSVEYALIAAVVVVLLTGGVYYLYAGIQARFDRLGWTNPELLLSDDFFDVTV